jgi:hypothetical protein
MDAHISRLRKPERRGLIEMLERSKGPAIQQVCFQVRKRPLNFALGKKRVMQTVVTVACKFSPSRILSIR